MKTLLDKIVDCAQSHFAWDAHDSPETTAYIEAFKDKVRKILKSKTTTKGKR